MKIMNCSLCGQEIKKNEKHFYIGCWNDNSTFSNIIRFHEKCFEEIAGEEYLKQLNSQR